MIKENTFYLISLGCAKNLVESEKLSNALLQRGFNITDDIKKAALIVINTCGFIKEAKEETIETILSALEEKPSAAKVIVFGCMVQRYYDEMKEALPEVDLFLPVLPYEEIAKRIAQQFPPQKASAKPAEKKILFTPESYAYIKIADGCKNYCSYCAIPLIRGALRSRTKEEIIAEVKLRLKSGVRELNIIAQDITSYGTDIYGKPALAELLREILKIKGDYWIRLLYLYPSKITDELINLIASEERIVKYLDIPLQHTEDRILKLMNRNYSKEMVAELLEKLRSRIPHLTLRTSIIVGFPTESEEEFSNLCNFLERFRFDHLGVFEYSPEEDTKAKELKPKVPSRIRAQRRKILLKKQSNIAFEQNRRFLGKTLPAVVESPFDDFGAVWTGRIYSQAPEVDGITYITNYTPEKGSLIKVLIKDIKDYDLIAEAK
ncbi:MAG: 30S ribosomal protein S12 methylthiotransferase RimO [bacterium]